MFHRHLQLNDCMVPLTGGNEAIVFAYIRTMQQLNVDPPLPRPPGDCREAAKVCV